MGFPSYFGLYIETHSVWKTPALFKTKTQRQALYHVDKTWADLSQLFMNLFMISDRKLGSGAYGEVWMAVDNYHQRQVACKIVKLHHSLQQRSGKIDTGRQWREVDLLKDISHVRKEILVLYLAHQKFSQTSYMLSVCSSPRKSCMKTSWLLCF